MQYNIHPIIVHFPIAFLFIYSIIKILPFQKWFPKFAWKDISLAVLIVGVLGAFAALSTGEIAEDLYRRNKQIIEMHAMFASISTWLYGALLVGEFARLFNQAQVSLDSRFTLIRKVSLLLERLLYKSFLAALVVVVALICIATTGLLGGVLVYGTSADPIAGSVLNILGLSI